MIADLYAKTKGYKTIAGLVCSFIVGGLMYTKMVDEETGRRMLEACMFLISFGLGDKVSTTLR